MPGRRHMLRAVHAVVPGGSLVTHRAPGRRGAALPGAASAAQAARAPWGDSGQGVSHLTAALCDCFVNPGMYVYSRRM